MALRFLPRSARKTRDVRTTIFLGAAVAFVLVCSQADTASAAYPNPVVGSEQAVACDHRDASEVAMAVLDSGGNAFDAVAAAALVLGVVNPSASGIGGGGFALVYSAKEHRVLALDFREVAPMAAPSGTRVGHKVGVPGELAGLESLVRRFGRKRLDELATPAINLAEKGFVPGPHLLSEYGLARGKMSPNGELARELDTFLRDPDPRQHRIRRPKLGASLRKFGQVGARALHEGAIAEHMVAAIQAEGGSITLQDLAAYQPKERVPLGRSFGSLQIATMPAPSAGGLMALELLTMFGATPSSELRALGTGSSAYIHLLAEGMRGALWDRFRYVGDPSLFPEIPAMYNSLLAPERMRKRRASIDAQTTHNPEQWSAFEHGTAHISIVDKEGNVVALTTTVNTGFGSGIEVDGFFLNDELDDFAAPDSGVAFGIPSGTGPNLLRPKARPVSSMTPTIIFRNNEPIAVVGGSGGQRIATGVSQAIFSHLVFEMDPAASVTAPRFHLLPNGRLLVERDTPKDVIEGLRARGENVELEPESVHPSVHMISLGKNAQGQRKLSAGADPRKHGAALAK
jgi:gamma-glutamyltranspeptidase / glutathione hydrolase